MIAHLVLDLDTLIYSVCDCEEDENLCNESVKSKSLMISVINILILMDVTVRLTHLTVDWRCLFLFF